VISLAAMRNPVRLKNLNARFLPLYVAGLALLLFFPPQRHVVSMVLPLIGLGVALRGWGAGHLVKNHELTVTGPYAYVRHPLYVGTILIATGFAVAVGGWLSLLMLVLIWPWFALHYFPRKERSESRRLEELYGDRFARYRAAVPALWPRLRAWADPDGNYTAPSGGRWDLDRYSDNNELGTLVAVLAGVLVFWLRGAVAA
jgi:protein-S-isoprenylcysteine O-methyltransferase Ste14